MQLQHDVRGPELQTQGVTLVWAPKKDTSCKRTHNHTTHTVFALLWLAILRKTLFHFLIFFKLPGGKPRRFPGTLGWAGLCDEKSRLVEHTCSLYFISPSFSLSFDRLINESKENLREAGGRGGPGSSERLCRRRNPCGLFFQQEKQHFLLKRVNPLVVSYPPENVNAFSLILKKCNFSPH